MDWKTLDPTPVPLAWQHAPAAESATTCGGIPHLSPSGAGSLGFDPTDCASPSPTRSIPPSLPAVGDDQGWMWTMTELNVAIGRAIRSWRDGKGVSVLAMVDRTGIPGTDIEAYEAGMRVPSERLQAICAGLDLRLDVFLGSVHPPQTSLEESPPAPEEGHELIVYFRQIRSVQARRFIIDLAHAIGDGALSSERIGS